jgi:hypothetical protein
MSGTRTIYLDNPEAKQKKALEKFFKDAGVTIKWGTSRKNADVIIDWPEDKVVCEPDLLHAGGRITCANAFAIAGCMKIDRATMGNLMNHLNIRIASCQLGCFK